MRQGKQPLSPPGGESQVPQRRWSDGGPAASGEAAQTAWSMAQHWPTVVATLSEQAVESSNLVLRAMEFLVGTGRLRRPEAKALSETLHRLRDTSLRAQQITRLASGRIRQARERVELSELIRNLLHARKDEFAAARAKVESTVSNVDVLLDPPVAVSLVGTLIDWGLSFSSHIEFSLDTPVWPEPAKLLVRVATPVRAEGATHQERGRRLNDGLHWMLLRQIALSANVTVTRSGGNGMALLTLEFPKTFLTSEGMATVELFEEASPAFSTHNTTVLLIVRDAELRFSAAEALRHAGMSVEAVGDLADARVCLARGRPQALVAASDVMRDAEFGALRNDVVGFDSACPIVEITETTPSFNISGFEGFEIAKVGRNDLHKDLAPAVLFELAKFV